MATAAHGSGRSRNGINLRARCPLYFCEGNGSIRGCPRRGAPRWGVRLRIIVLGRRGLPHLAEKTASGFALHADRATTAERAECRGAAPLPNQRAILGQIVRRVRAPMNSPRCSPGAIVRSISLAGVPTRRAGANTCSGATSSSARAASRNSGERNCARSMRLPSATKPLSFPKIPSGRTHAAS